MDPTLALALAIGALALLVPVLAVGALLVATRRTYDEDWPDPPDGAGCIEVWEYLSRRR